MKKRKDILFAHVDGTVIKLEEIEDIIFSTKLIGEGLAILPKNGIIKAPQSGIVKIMPEMKHAVGLLLDNGLEVLIHCGIDTVLYEGVGFTSYVEMEEHVEMGQVLLEMDIDYYRDKGVDITTPLIVTNFRDFDLEHVDEGEVQAGIDSIITIK